MTDSIAPVVVSKELRAYPLACVACGRHQTWLLPPDDVDLREHACYACGSRSLVVVLAAEDEPGKKPA